MAISLAMAQRRSECFDIIYQKNMTINLKNVPERIRTIHRVKGLEKDSTINLIGS